MAEIKRLDNLSFGFLLDSNVIIEWRDVMTGLIDLLRSHDFGKEPNFTEEFHFLETKVPEGPRGRSSSNYTRAVIATVMIYAVEGKLLVYYLML